MTGGNQGLIARAISAPRSASEIPIAGSSLLRPDVRAGVAESNRHENDRTLGNRKSDVKLRDRGLEALLLPSVLKTERA